MPRDLYAEFGIGIDASPDVLAEEQGAPRDLFAEFGIEGDVEAEPSPSVVAEQMREEGWAHDPDLVPLETIKERSFQRLKGSVGGLYQFAGEGLGTAPVESEPTEVTEAMKAAGWSRDPDPTGVRAVAVQEGRRLISEAQEKLKATPYAATRGTVEYYAGHAGEALLSNVLPAFAISMATGNPAAGLPFMFGQVLGEKYGQARLEGREIPEAAQDALVHAGTETITEVGPFAVALKPGIALFKRFLATAGAEGAGEVVNSALQRAYDEGVVNEKSSLGDFFKVMTNDEAMKEYTDAFIVGAMVGGPLGIAGGAAQAQPEPAPPSPPEAIPPSPSDIYNIDAPGYEGQQWAYAGPSEEASATMYRMRGPEGVERDVGINLLRRIDAAETIGEVTAVAEESAAETETIEDFVAGYAEPEPTPEPTTLSERAEARRQAPEGFRTAMAEAMAAAQTIRAQEAPAVEQVEPTKAATPPAPESVGDGAIASPAPARKGEAAGKQATGEVLSKSEVEQRERILDLSKKINSAIELLEIGDQQGLRNVINNELEGDIDVVIARKALKEAGYYLPGMPSLEITEEQERLATKELEELIGYKRQPAPVTAPKTLSQRAEANRIAKAAARRTNVPAPTVDTGGKVLPTKPVPKAEKPPVAPRPAPDVVAPAAEGAVGVTQQDIVKAGAEAATSPKNNLPEPTDAQKEVGNYNKGHVLLHGMDISIENPKGSKRSGTDSDGKKWEVPIVHDYGYIKDTVGKDKDHLDVFLGPKATDPATPVFVVDQVTPKTGAFDEHKILMGFAGQMAARKGYLANYEKGWKGIGSITKMSMPEFKEWIKGDTTKAVSYQKKQETPSASQDTKTATVHGDVLETPGKKEGQGKVPARKGGKRVPKKTTVKVKQEPTSAVKKQAEKKAKTEAAEAAFFGGFAPENIEQHPRLKDDDTLIEMREMAENAGWAEQGGRLVRDAEGKAASRTAWVPIEAWFAEKPKGVTETHIKEAIQRIDDDRALTKPQRQAVAFMLGYINDKNVSEFDATGIDEFDSLETFDKTLVELAEQLGDAGEAILELAAKQDLSNAETRARLEARLRPASVEGAAGTEEGGGFDLEGQTEAQVQQQVAEAEQRKQSELEENRKAKADRERGEFVLSGSNRAVDEAEARGQKPLFMQLGRRAKTADLSALGSAAQMEQEGADSETIRKETGWHLGMDDKWRFEISDKDIKLKDAPKTQAGQRATLKKGPVPPHWLLGDFIDHPKLFEAYPWLKNVKVATQRNEGGAFYPDTNTMLIQAGARSKWTNTLVHEIQHAVQDIEGFGRGGDVAEFEPNFIKRITKPEGAVNEAVKIYENRYKGKQKSDFPKSEQRIFQLVSAIAAFDKMGERGEALKLAKDVIPLDSYRRLAGEIEARDVQERRTFTDGQRAATPPYVSQGISKEDAIIRFNKGAAAKQIESASTVPKLRSSLEAEFGKLRIRAMERASKLKLVQSVPAGYPQDTAGFYEDGAITLIADNSVGIYDGLAEAVMAHEVAHSTETPGLKEVLGVNFDKFYSRLEALYEAGDETAVVARGNVPENTDEALVPSERVAYFVQEAVLRTKTLSPKAGALYRQIAAAVKAWFATTTLGKQFSFKLSDEFVTALVKRSVGRGTGEGAVAKLSRTRMPNGFSDIPDADKKWVQDTLPDTSTKATVKGGITKLTSNWFDRANQGIFDDKWSFRKLGIDIWKLAHLIPSASGALEGMLDYSPVEMNAEGVLQPKTTAADRKANKAPDRGLIKVLTPLGEEANRFFLWVAAKRAQAINTRADKATKEAASLKTSITAAKKYITNLTDAGGQAKTVLALQKDLKRMETARADALKRAEIQERHLTGDRLDALLRLNKGRMEGDKSRAELYDKVWEGFREFNESVLKIAQQSGLISKDQVEMWRSEFYVPFYRIMDEQTEVHGPQSADQLVRQAAWKKYHGSARHMGDLFGNTLMNWNHLLSSSLRNQAGAKALKAAEDMGIARRTTEKGKSAKAVFVRENGEKVWYEVDDAMILQSLTMLNMEGMNTLTMRSARKVKRLFTVMVTSTPSFRGANILRDMIMAPAVNDMSKNIFSNVMEGYKLTDVKTLTRAMMLVGGGEIHFGHNLGTDADATKVLVEKHINPLHVLDNPNAFKSFYKLAEAGWDWWQEGGSRAENINRAAAYMAALKKTSSDADNVFSGDLLAANFIARDVIDFNRHGAWKATRVLIDTIPFLNARLQGIQKMSRAAADPKILRKQFLPVVGTYVMAGVALYLANMGDDDFRDEDEWLKDAYHLIKIPGTDITFKYPKPFEVGAIETVFERIAEQIVDDKVHGKLFWARMVHLLDSTLAIDPRPQIIRPMMEVAANKNNFTGRSIESFGMQFKPVTDRRREWTSTLAVGMSHVLNEVPWDKVQLSPVQVDHIIQGYFGAIGASVAQYLDYLVLDRVMDKPSDPAWRIQKHPGYGRFFKTGPNKYTKYGSVFYDQMRELDMLHKQIRSAKMDKDFEEAREIQGDNRAKLIWRKRYNRQNKRIRRFRKLMENNRKSDKTPQQKLATEESLNSRIIDIQKRIVNASREAFD